MTDEKLVPRNWVWNDETRRWEPRAKIGYAPYEPPLGKIEPDSTETEKTKTLDEKDGKRIGQALGRYAPEDETKKREEQTEATRKKMGKYSGLVGNKIEWRLDKMFGAGGVKSVPAGGKIPKFAKTKHLGRKRRRRGDKMADEELVSSNWVQNPKTGRWEPRAKTLEKAGERIDQVLSRELPEEETKMREKQAKATGKQISKFAGLISRRIERKTEKMLKGKKKVKPLKQQPIPQFIIINQPSVKKGRGGKMNVHTGYCAECGSPKRMNKVRRITMKNKRRAITGKCAECGGTIYKIVRGRHSEKQPRRARRKPRGIVSNLVK